MKVREIMRARLLYLLVICCSVAGLAAASPDDDAARKAGLKPPIEWVYPSGRLQVHVVNGLWYHYYRVDEALALLGGAQVSESWHAMGLGFGHPGPWNPHRGGHLLHYPSRYTDLLANHLIIICNIDAKAFGAVRRAQLREYVYNGGSVLFLGGRFTFGQQFHGTAFEEMAPVTFTDKGFDLVHVPDGLVAVAGEVANSDKAVATLPEWGRQPRVYWYHNVQPKKEARMLMRADDHPLFIIGDYGKGRVGVFAGTVMGDPKPGQLPVWEWDSWPRALSLAVSQLAGNTQAGNHTLSAATRTALTELLAGRTGGQKFSQKTLQEMQAAQMTEAAALCQSEETALFILRAALTWPGDIPERLADDAGRNVPRYADQAFAGGAKGLLESGMPNKTRLGLRILGATGAAGTVERLDKFVRTGQVEDIGMLGGLDDLDPGAMIAQADPGAGAAIRLAALDGLGNTRNPKALPVLKRAIQEYGRKGKHGPIANPDDTLTPEHKLYQQALMSALRCGDATAAKPVVTALLENLYIVSRARTEENKTDERLARVRAAIPDALSWQQDLYAQLAAVPASALPALAGEIATITDWRITPIALAAFSGRQIPAEAMTALKGSPIAAVARLGSRRQ